MRTTSYIHAFLFDYVCVAEPPIHSMHCKTLFNILQKENQQTRQRTCMPFIFLRPKKGKESLFLPTRPCGTNRDELSHEKPHAKCMHLWSKIIDSSCLTVIIPSSLQTHFKSRVLRQNETNVKSPFYRKRDRTFKRHFRQLRGYH